MTLPIISSELRRDGNPVIGGVDEGAEGWGGVIDPVAALLFEEFGAVACVKDNPLVNKSTMIRFNNILIVCVNVFQIFY